MSSSQGSGIRGALATVASISLAAGSIVLAAAATAQGSPLSPSERVACRAKVEDVYWAHRIWPPENRAPKPSREAVVPDAVIAQRVEQSRRDETALAALRGRPLSPPEIQSEIDRQARSTRDPAMLRELWAALGNDPTRVAECLVRPELVERLFRAAPAGGRRPRTATRRRAESEWAAASAPPVYRLPAITGGACTLDGWTPTDTTGAPTKRFFHSAVWTGAEMIVWGGIDGISFVDVNSGSRYSPASDSWTPMSLLNTPSPRNQQTAVWTGTEMIVWGGIISTADHRGGRYSPGSDSWTPMSLVNAPAGAQQHTAVWTGSEMITWGGNINHQFGDNNGGRYTPATDTWMATSLNGAPEPRIAHTAVWTGSEMIVWGGVQEDNVTLDTGGRYTPATDSWTATSLVNAPPPRDELTSVWTGSEMIVWGGSPNNGNLTTNSGGGYSPATDTWRATNLAGAPTARYWPTAVWTGGQMIVWGGHGGANLNSGGRYTPGTDTWVATTTANAPQGRLYHTEIWTGNQMIVWGGADFTTTLIALDTGGLYCAIASPVANLTLTKTHTGSFTQGQAGAVYTITVLNLGSAATAGPVSVADVLPAGLTATGLGGAGWACDLGTLTCGRSDALAAGQIYPAISLTVDVADNALASLVNRATVSGGGEVDTTDDTATDATVVLSLPASLFTLSPCRLVDTRGAAGPLGAPALQPGAQRTFALSGACGIPATAKALSLNVTVTHPTAAGDLRIFPAGSPAPLTSAINFAAGQTRANNAVAVLGSGGLTVRLDSFGTSELILDVNGYFE